MAFILNAMKALKTGEFSVPQLRMIACAGHTPLTNLLQ
jgi:hypothetical protein